MQHPHLGQSISIFSQTLIRDPVAGWCVLHAGTLAVVASMTAGVLVLHAEPLCVERARVGQAAGRGAGPAHGRAAVGDVGRLVGPSEADPVYVSYNRPCLRINRSRVI